MPEGGGVRLLDALHEAAEALVDELGADACAVSRVVGDLLIMLTEHVPEGGTVQLGQGYLIAEYPQTRRVLDQRVPGRACLTDPTVDAAEATLLRTLGYTALLMLPFELQGELWGLVEIYRVEPRPFTDADAQTALATLAARLGG
jgi:GAF domain-containing protein